MKLALKVFVCEWAHLPMFHLMPCNVFMWLMFPVAFRFFVQICIKNNRFSAASMFIEGLCVATPRCWLRVFVLFTSEPFDVAYSTEWWFHLHSRSCGHSHPHSHSHWRRDTVWNEWGCRSSQSPSLCKSKCESQSELPAREDFTS